LPILEIFGKSAHYFGIQIFSNLIRFSITGYGVYKWTNLNFFSVEFSMGIRLVYHQQQHHSHQFHFTHLHHHMYFCSCAVSVIALMGVVPALQ
jgi:hypothetical protein